jgi:hypothetical protein
MYADNARSILCTLVGSEAAIVAIVVSLTLIAIELTASAYSPRVIKISLRNPDMWFLLLIYGVSIFYAIVLLKQLPYDSWIPYDDVSLAFWLGVFSYVALVPYLLNIIRLLMPENIIERLSKDVTTDGISDYIEASKTSKGVENRSKKSPQQNVNNTKVKSTKDPVQPIVDIIYGSLRIHDLETIRYGLKTIVKLTEDINPEKEDQEVPFSIYFCRHLRRVGKLAVSIADEGSAIEVITTFEKIGKKTVNKKLKDATMEVVSDIRVIGEAAIEKGLKETISKAISSLEEVGKAAAVEEGLKDATKEAAKSLGAVGEAAVEKRLKDMILEVIASLKVVREAPQEKDELDEVTEQIVSSLGVIGEAAAEKKLKDATKGVITAIKIIGEATAGKRLEDATWQAILSLEAVGEAVAEKELKSKTALYLGVVGKAAAKKELRALTERAVESLEIIGKSASERGFKDATKQAASSLVSIGTIAAVKKGEELKEVTERTASSLASLTISSKEIVETAILDYESTLTKTDLDSYRKFKTLYEQALKN